MGVSVPMFISRVPTAVRWVKANAAAYRGDAGRIAVFGHSAGGHLAIMASLHGNERTYTAAWQPDKPLADNISGITLTVRAVSKDAAYITVQYRFDSHPRC